MALADDVAKMRGITRASNMLNQFQINHLYAWFLAASTHVKKKEDVVVSVDFELRIVNFDIKKHRFTPFKYRNKLDMLTSWVQYLLGADWNIKVIYPKKMYYESSNRTIVNRNEDDMWKVVEKQVQ